MKKQSKSAKVRKLLGEGFTPAAITKQMRLPRNFVYQVQFAMRKKEQPAGGELPLDHPMFAKKPTKVLPGSKAKGANAVQVGGDHYRKYGAIQPWDLWTLWDLNPFQAAILKYVVRYRDKDGMKDLDKAKHFLDKLIEVEGGKK